MVVGQVAYDMDSTFLQGAAKLNSRYDGNTSEMGFFCCFGDTPYGVVVGNGDNIESGSGRQSDHLLRGINTIGDIAMDMEVYFNLCLFFPWRGYLYSANTILNFRLFSLRSTVMVRESPTMWL